jgi:hypothetical protein
MRSLLVGLAAALAFGTPPGSTANEKHVAARPLPRWAHSAAELGGRLYVVPASDTWAARANMPAGRSHMTVSAVGGRIYAFGGGITHADREGALSLAEVYDTVADRWARLADMPTPRVVPASGVLNGRIYVVGGVATSARPAPLAERMRKRAPLSVVEVFDVATGHWTSERRLATPRGWFSATALKSRLYLLGGRSLAPEGHVVEVDGAIPGLEVYPPVR